MAEVTTPISWNTYDLSKGRVIVLADEELSLFITWNESMVFQVWTDAPGLPGRYEEVSMFQPEVYCKYLTDARGEAHRWMERYKTEMGIDAPEKEEG